MGKYTVGDLKRELGIIKPGKERRQMCSSATVGTFRAAINPLIEFTEFMDEQIRLVQRHTPFKKIRVVQLTMGDNTIDLGEGENFRGTLQINGKHRKFHFDMIPTLPKSDDGGFKDDLSINNKTFRYSGINNNDAVQVINSAFAAAHEAMQRSIQAKRIELDQLSAYEL